LIRSNSQIKNATALKKGNSTGEYYHCAWAKTTLGAILAVDILSTRHQTAGFGAARLEALHSSESPNDRFRVNLTRRPGFKKALPCCAA